MQTKLNKARIKKLILESFSFCLIGCCHQLIIISDKIDIAPSLAVFITFPLINQSGSAHSHLVRSALC